MDCVVHGVAKSWTQLSDFHFHFGTLVRAQEAVGGEGRSLASTPRPGQVLSCRLSTVFLGETSDPSPKNKARKESLWGQAVDDPPSKERQPSAGTLALLPY